MKVTPLAALRDGGDLLLCILAWVKDTGGGELATGTSMPTLVLPMLFTKELFMSFSVLFLGVGVSTLCFAVLMPTKPVSGFRMMQR